MATMLYASHTQCRAGLIVESFECLRARDSYRRQFMPIFKLFDGCTAIHRRLSKFEPLGERISLIEGSTPISRMYLELTARVLEGILPRLTR